MEEILSYKEAVEQLQFFKEENEKEGVKDIYWFMYPWEGEDAKRLCGTEKAIELVGFLGDIDSFQNIYVTPETAEKLKKKFGIDYFVDAK